MVNSEVDVGDDGDSFRTVDGKLEEGEIFWRDHQPWLKEKGYTLRTRYQPDWVASWLRQPNSKKPWNQCEDGFSTRRVDIMDARKVDGSLVAMKLIKPSRYPNEITVGKLFSSEPLAGNPSNYCVPILDVLLVPDDSDAAIIVMPLLWDHEFFVPFETIGEAVAYFHQIFDGLRFMHQNLVAHRDCKFDNIMADITPLYQGSPPQPWNPQFRYDSVREPKIISSRTRNPLKYYFIDFGLSRLYKQEDSPHLERPFWGGDKSVPEFKYDDPCDPFAVDVYCIGNYVRSYFIQGQEGVTPSKKGFEFMDQLLRDMTQDDPRERPTMEQVVTRFADISQNLSNWKLRSRVVPTADGSLKRVVRSITHWTKQLEFMARGVPAIPMP